jgi:hypothetical protein
LALGPEASNQSFPLGFEEGVMATRAKNDRERFGGTGMSGRTIIRDMIRA